MKNERYKVWKIISSRITCDESCPYTEICPSMMDGVLNEVCIVQQNYQRLFDSFYNLYLGNFDGLKTEMTNIAYHLKERADTPEEALQYFNALTKIMSTCYAPEKNSKDDIISEIFLNISPLSKGKSK